MTKKPIEVNLKLDVIAFNVSGLKPRLQPIHQLAKNFAVVVMHEKLICDRDHDLKGSVGDSATQEHVQRSRGSYG